MIISIATILLGIGYFFLMGIISWALLKLHHYNSDNDLTVSIIVASRNEESVIINLLDSLTKIKYPEEKYEVILIDDDSSDNTYSIMNNYAKKLSNWKVLQHKKNETSLRGKKGALTLGIQNSKGDIILTTDADCIVPPNWVKSMVSCFKDEVGMVLGHSPVEKRKGFFNILQRFDSLCEASAAAASTYFNKPCHSNGRNLAFRKKAFNEVGGYNKISQVGTGDDFFLSQLLRKSTKWKFIYNIDPDSFVFTQSGTFSKEYLNQQLRRNSKAFYLTLPFFLIASWIFLFHLFLAILLLFPSMIKIFLILVLIKFFIEFLPVKLGANIFKQKNILRYYPLMWFVYPIVIIVFSLLGSLQLYKWK